MWPQLVGGLAPTINPEILATYTHRGGVPRELWRQLFAKSKSEIGILVYAGLFLAEDIDPCANAVSALAQRLGAPRPHDPRTIFAAARTGDDIARMTGTERIRSTSRPARRSR